MTKPLTRQQTKGDGKRIVKAECDELRRKVLRIVNKQLRVIGRQAEIQHVAMRLDIRFSEAELLLSGKKELTLENISDLCRSAGLVPLASLRKVPKRLIKRHPQRPLAH